GISTRPGLPIRRDIVAGVLLIAFVLEASRRAIGPALSAIAVAFTLYPAEIPLPRKTSATRGALEISDLQAVERDFAFVVDADVEALTLINAAAGADKVLIADVRIFDEFIGGNLGEGKKSLAMTVRLQPKDSTLKEADIETVSAKIIEKVTKATGGTLRG
ncbi:MAG: hypothetical protein RQ750_15115, partial [Roseovarius sp.]|nr:hypothetical protein [Roseovarius sp.]